MEQDMHYRYAIAMTFAMLGLFETLAASQAAAQWTCADPITSVLVADDPPGLQQFSIQSPRGVVADLNGGVFIAWTESSGQTSDRVRLQHLDADGNRLLGDQGMIALDEPSTGSLIWLLPDSTGGVILLHHGNDAHVRAHRFDSSGNRLWGPRGVPVLPFDCENAETNTAMVHSDQAGGFYFLWRKKLFVIGQPDEVWVNHIAPDGQQAWGGSCGVQAAITDWTLSSHGVLLDPDGSGGLFISMTTNDTNVRAQRLDALGTRLWGPMGILVSNLPGPQFARNPAPDGEGGILVLWYQGHPDNSALDSVWGSRLDGDGNDLWTPNGERITPDGWFLGPTLADGHGGAWLSVWNWGNERDHYLQRVTKLNQLVFPDFLPITTAPSRQNIPRLQADNTEGVFLVWTDWRNPGGFMNQDIYFQHVTLDGQLLETADGSPVSTADGRQGDPEMQIATNALGEVFVAWTDVSGFGAGDTWDVYAEKVPCLVLPDADGDGIPDTDDNCPIDWNPMQEDVDNDGIGNACDNCPAHTNPDQADCDDDDVGDVCAIAAGTSADCNGNFLPDNCDIADGASQDANQNGTPDECECNAGDICFGPAVRYTALGIASSDRSLAVGDVNGDAFPDVVVLIREVPSSGIEVFLNQGTGALDPPSQYYGTGRVASALALEDLDGDGDLDAAVSNSGYFEYGGSWVIALYRNNGQGAFTAYASHFCNLTGSETSVTGVALSDFDGDNDMDMAAINWDSSKVCVFDNLGDGTMAPIADFDSNERSRSIAAGDLNGDGAPDLALVNAFGPLVTVGFNNGNAAFGSPLDLGAQSSGVSIVLADFDNDSDLDVAMGNAGWPTIPETPRFVAVMMNNGNETFASQVEYDPGPPVADFDNGGEPLSLAAADFDDDGDLDLAVANCNNCLTGGSNLGPSNASVLPNNGDGTFAAPRQFEVFDAEQFVTWGGPRSIAAADMDGDGDTDLVTFNATRPGSTSEEYTVSVLMNTTPLVPGAPIPTVSEWGMLIMTLLLLTLGTVVLRAPVDATVARESMG